MRVWCVNHIFWKGSKCLVNVWLVWIIRSLNPFGLLLIISKRWKVQWLTSVHYFNSAQDRIVVGMEANVEQLWSCLCVVTYSTSSSDIPPSMRLATPLTPLTQCMCIWPLAHLKLTWVFTQPLHNIICQSFVDTWTHSFDLPASLCFRSFPAIIVTYIKTT